MLYILVFLCAIKAASASGWNCTAASQQQSLLEIFSDWRGSEWHVREGWLDISRKCEDPATGTNLPAHCCWHGIQCCISLTCSEGQRPDVDRCGCQPGLVWEIDLSSNKLEGNFSSLNHNVFACALSAMRLSNNKLHGILGPSFPVYRKLETVDLIGNNLEGTLPSGIGQISSLNLLFLSGNSLVGTVPSDICGNNTKLFSLALDDNNFSGRLDLSRCKKLGYLVAKGNNFSGIFRPGNAGLPDLKGVFLEENGLHGTLPNNMFISFLPNLEQLGLSNNMISGPLPVMSMYSLKYVVLHDNRLVGPVPESWAIMARPGLEVTLNTNYLSCCGTSPLLPVELSDAAVLRIDEVYSGVDYSAPILPSYLELSEWLEDIPVLPRQSFKASGMRCPKLKMAGQEEDPASILYWYLDPSYYMFTKCECQQGFRLVNLTRPGRLPYFECQVLLDASDESESWEEAYPWAIVIIVVVGCALLITLLLGLYLYKGTEVVQRLSNLKKRMQGLPTSGPFTAVVTDIEGWTDLCSQYPELSWKVLSIHNSILRRARWYNFGSTHETEGDSFTMVFYDAKDAVAFCLQAQQMLSTQQWPRSSRRKVVDSEEQTILLMSSDANPVSHHQPLKDQQLKKSRSTSSFSVVNLLSSSKLHHNLDQEATDSMDIRVRMGLASGLLCPGESLHAHPTIALAKEVSDAAVGGQILMESSTYHAVKDSLGELGTVDSQGMHLDRLRMRRVFNWSACFCFRSIAPAVAAADDAVVLDMGTYTKSQPGQDCKQAQTPPLTSKPGRSRMSLVSTRMSSLAGTARRALSPDDLHLYQALPAGGAERAKLWGGKLRIKVPLKDSLSKGYFDAPGTLAAPLGISKGSAKASLPLVTPVFASVEHARLLSSRETRQVERGLLTCARDCLDLKQVQGDGYLCRSFGNLRLMLCFSKPEAALVWSCAMQESMMVQAWPKTALKEPFQEMRDQNGQLIFRGPRLKVGISQGYPDSIQPDHLGRADYHGDCVNSAARFEAGAAQGGMIVCEHEVAMRAAEAWAAMQICLDTEKARESPLQISRSWSAAQSAQSSIGKQGTPQDGQLQKDPVPFRAPAALSSSPPNKVHLRALASSRSSPHSEPLHLLPPLLGVASAHFPSPGLQDGIRSSNNQVRSSIHVYQLGSFRFKGKANTKSMVYVLQDKLSARAATFAPKSVNPGLATLVSQQQPEGVTKSTFLVPLPAIEADVALSPQEQGARPNVRFELDSQHESDRLVEMSDPSWKRTLSVHSQDTVPSLFLQP